jgi:hypothetical protein
MTGVSKQEAEQGLAFAKQFVEVIRRLITRRASFKLSRTARDNWRLFRHAILAARLRRANTAMQVFFL